MPEQDDNTIIHSIRGHPIRGYHLKPLFNHTMQLWDITVLSYLLLLEQRSPDTIKVHDFYVIDRLEQKDYSCVHRLYRTKKATDFTWTFFPTIKNRHFYLIVAHNDNTGEVKISSYDSMHLLHSSELQAVRQYYQDAISTETTGYYYNFVLSENAADKMIVQQDGSSCGVYCAMIADCLTSNVDITLLTPSSIIKDRQRMAQNLISQDAPVLVTAHVTSSVSQSNKRTLPKFLQGHKLQS